MTLTYRIILPLHDNLGNAFRDDVMAHAESKILDLDGVTGYSSWDGKGVWKSPTGEVFFDRVRFIEFDAAPDFGLDYGFHLLGKFMLGYFDQEGIYMKVGGRAFVLDKTTTFNID